MKKMKKLASILLAAIMVLAMMVPAMAAEGTSTGTEGIINVEGTMSGKTLEAYQIFSGTQAEGEDALGNIVWGNGINAETFLLALVGSDILGEGVIKETSTAADVAKALVDKDDATLQRFAELAKNYVTEKTKDLAVGDNKVASGYYLVLDKTEGAAIVNVALLQVTNDSTTNVHMKTNIPSVDKDVLDETEVGDPDEKSDDGPDIATNGNGWGETADHEIGETFQFKLTAKIPADVNVNIYKAYEVIFHDAISNGITYLGNLHVYASNGDISTDSSKEVFDYDNTGWFGENGIAVDGAVNGTLKISDVNKLGLKADQDIYITVIYDAKLNESATVSDPKNGNLTSEQNNNEVFLEYSNTSDGEGKGTTEEDKVYVFTYKLPGKKVDEENKALEGAKFALYKLNAAGEAEFANISDGKIEWLDPVKKDAGDKYFELPDDATEVTSGEDGSFSFEGLDIGIYYLTETFTPAGYNTMDDEKVTITASHVETPLTGGASTTELVNGESEVQVQNLKGTTLPETGGIGTTIFYVLGSILVLGAVILLVTKRRMGAEK